MSGAPKGYSEITPDGFSYARLRVGLVVRAPNGREVYCQPGDDSAAMLATIEALEEHEDESGRALLAEMALGDYFA